MSRPHAVFGNRFFFGQYVFWLDHILGGAATAMRGIPGVSFELIRDLQALPQAPMLGLLTGNIQLGAEIKLRHYGLWEHFMMGGFADDHEDRNYIAAAALQRGRRVLDPHLQPHEIVVIGDTPFDVRCGKFIGAKTLAVATGGATLKELKHCMPPTGLWPTLRKSLRRKFACSTRGCCIRSISSRRRRRPRLSLSPSRR